MGSRAFRSLLLPLVALVALASCSSGGSDDGSPDTSESVDVDAARAGLARWLDAHPIPAEDTSRTESDCPLLTAGDLATAVEDAGLGARSLDGWLAEISYEDGSEELLAVACGADSIGAFNDAELGDLTAVSAIDAKGVTDAYDDDDHDVAGEDLGPGPDRIGGTLAGQCGVLPGTTGSTCMVTWTSGDFVVGLTMAGDDVTTEAAAEALSNILPTVLTNLAEA